MRVPVPALPRCRGIPLSALLLSGLVAACGPENTYQPPPPPSVTVAPPLKKPVTSYLEVTGNTKASRTVDLTARVAGVLTAVNFRDGADVKAGDVLFTIESDQYQAQLALAQATQLQNEATLVGSQLEFTRQQQLVATRTASQATLDRVRAEYDASKAAVQGAEANVALAKLTLGYTEVTAPFDGRIDRRQVDTGNLVGQGSPTKLATIQQLAPLYVYFSVSETDVLRIRDMLRARGSMEIDVASVPVEVGLREGADYPHKGHLDYIAPSVDSSTGTLEVRAVMPNTDSALLPGLFVRLRVPVEQRDDVLLVPQNAVASGQSGPYLLVVGEDKKVQTRLVRTGQAVGKLQVIESGLAADDRVVVNGTMRAVPGNEVAPTVVALAEDGSIPVTTAAVTK